MSDVTVGTEWEKLPLFTEKTENKYWDTLTWRREKQESSRLTTSVSPGKQECKSSTKSDRSVWN